MACSSCAKAARSRSAVSAVNRSAATGSSNVSKGLQPTNPTILGDPADETLKRVRVVRAVANLKPQQAAWVTGSEVEERIADGTLRDISHATQSRRMWMVGKYAYTDKTKAERVAATLGMEAIEVA